MSEKFFSIAVVCLNVEDTIEDTINSILIQDFDDYEIIVKDGLSKDNTIANIPKSEKIKMYEEKDSGIYDAMNQAINYSNGRYICFLNSGDLFDNPHVLSEIYKALQGKDDCGVIYGDYKRNNVVFKQPLSISPFYIFKTPLCHQSMFISKKMFDINGLYNTDYKILADYEHTLHDYFSGNRFEHCDVIVCNYLGGGVSESAKGAQLKAQERIKIINKYFDQKSIKKYNFMIALSMKKIRQFMIGDKSPKFLRKVYRWLVNMINR